MSNHAFSSSLPDIARESSNTIRPRIDEVGMQGIAIPLTIHDSKGTVIASTAKANVTVSLDDPHAKGIHMSRLYNLLQEHLSNKVLGNIQLSELMDALVSSQAGLSTSATLSLQFTLTVSRPALISKTAGYQHYDAALTLKNDEGKIRTQLCISIPYSSTCPCSASLSRQALAEAFQAQFENKPLDTNVVSEWLASKQASIATAHAQRSFAHITLNLMESTVPDFIDIIDLAENTLATPLQTAVKREDEQEFARRNAQNLMFVEDAVRRLHDALSTYSHATYFHVKVEHQESLHAHDAVAEISGAINSR
ncbi:GTP cyclohydrolase FolE2 [Alteromonas sp. KC3]|uniref:GTP cyclohydrolase FolE2 n=1 Tax=unclassified Alteromonas TaxID=2614992 RepID=UPI00193530A4|nr:MULTISPECIES: GTP cyclohydrolase FolE2 [unclassified Alteromonas]BCO20830.1 GTP cyclohydrolase FolE2 [Alteromonas sp. KC3]BCO24800.1 GTP cyclohydrolase FolE2 [Alteromonas sp. KC14]